MTPTTPPSSTVPSSTVPSSTAPSSTVATSTVVPWPNFIIGGAPRAGTTFLASTLAGHPGVEMAQPFIPEPKIFMGAAQSEDIYRERYAQFFARHGVNEHGGREQNLRRRGEKTSYYLESASICRLIHQTVPEVRLVFIVREPVARAYSNYLWSCKNELETLPFEEAVDLEGQRPNPLPPEKAYARPFDYMSRGDYATLAAPYLEFFAERVRFFLYEDLRTQPNELMRAVQHFLDIDPRPLSQLGEGVLNSAQDVGPDINSKLEHRLRERMEPLVKRFAEMTGLDLDAWGY